MSFVRRGEFFVCVSSNPSRVGIIREREIERGGESSRKEERN